MSIVPGRTPLSHLETYMGRCEGLGGQAVSLPDDINIRAQTVSERDRAAIGVFDASTNPQVPLVTTPAGYAKGPADMG